MKLSKFYSNRPQEFEPVSFNTGLSAVLAEIRLPENQDRDTHNLGKTTLGRLLDFGFLASKKSNFFLFKHFELFEDYVFFLELELGIASYLTVKRSVSEPTKISFKKHNSGGRDFCNVGTAEWDHSDLPFDRAREMLDSLLDWRAVKPWTFRKGMGYLLRSQDDYRDVFHLRKFAGAHSDWKPFIAHILGFDAELIASHYKKESELSEISDTAITIQHELGGSIEDISKVDGLMLLKRQEADKKEKLLDAFDFRRQDTERTTLLVDDLDGAIAELNKRRYSLNHNRKKILTSLERDEIMFRSDEARQLFEEAGLLFPSQLTKDFDQLLAFNRAITDERSAYLKEELLEIESELKEVNASLDSLGKKRSDILSFLGSTDVFLKYKKVSDDLVTLRADIAMLEKQKEYLHRLQELRTQIRALKDECGTLQSKIEADVEAQNSDAQSLFSTIRLYFNEIVEEVIDRKALLSVSPNQLGHLEFKAEILDEAGNASSADLGHTYRKLLCVAFDLAVLRGHIDERFPKFVFHDGVFESLDDRKKLKLLDVIRRYAQLGLQPVITLIDSDLPGVVADEGQPVFSDDEIVLRLHDEGDSGRLFRTRPW